MDMSAIDFGTLIAFVGLYLKTQQDKSSAAEAVRGHETADQEP
jgi:hypothetical protein